MFQRLKMICMLIFLLAAVSTVARGDNQDYRLGFGDELSVSFWADGFQGALQVCLAPIRPDGKISLAFTVTQREDYTLGAGDVIQITVMSMTDLTEPILVRPDGKIALPLIGEVQVEGLTPAQLTKNLVESFKTYIKQPVITVNVTKPRRLPVMETLTATGLTADELTQAIQSMLSKYMSNPKVAVSFTKYRTVRVYVLGEAARPGMFEISKSHTILDAIGLAGGYTKYANKNEIYLIQTDKRKYVKVDLKRLLQKGDLTQNYELRDGDVVYFAKNGLSFVNDILPIITSIYYVKIILEP